MRRLRPISCVAGCVCILLGWTIAPAVAQERLRVLIETDLGGDADDQASFVRFLLYSNEWDIEGILADRPAATFRQDPARDHLNLQAANGWELAQEYLKAYGRIQANLANHKRDYPTHDFLRERTVPAHNDTDEGVRLIIAAADRHDARPIWYGNWGSNSGAQSNLRRAFDQVKSERSPEEHRRFVQKFRICTLDGGRETRQGHEDQVLLHIEAGYPVWDGGRWYHRFRPLTETAGGMNVDRDVRRDHGPLGALYTTPKEGDSWTFVYLIPTGLGDPLQPTWGGWGGRYGRRSDRVAGVEAEKRKWSSAFYWANVRDTWNSTTHRDNTARRWAEHLQNDFRARLDWCVAERYEDANHEPVPCCQGDLSRCVLMLSTSAGSSVSLDARGSTDPDGDALNYLWFVYPEPGTCTGEVNILDADAAQATLEVPSDATGKTIHVILQVTDDGSPPLTRYRRLVITAN